MTSISGDPPNRAGSKPAAGVEGQQLPAPLPAADHHTASPGFVSGAAGVVPQPPATSTHEDGTAAPAHGSDRRLDTWTSAAAPRPLEQELTPPPAVGPAGHTGDWASEPPPVQASNLRTAFVTDEDTQSLQAAAPELQVQVEMPTEQQPLSEMEPERAEHYFRYLDSAFADIDTHRGVMHGPMQWPAPSTPAGQERVESLVSRMFDRRESPQNAYTTLILYMPASSDPKRTEKAQGYATAVSRQLRTLVEHGTVLLATATALHQALTRHIAAGPSMRESAAITRMFERKRLEVVAVSDASASRS